MKISYNRLKDYVSFTYSPEELGKVLTGTGLEVEGIEKAGGVHFTFENVFVGFVETVVKHPDADRLRVCTVNIGQPEKLTIVCGAPNVAENQTVAVAVVGAILYPTGSTEPLKIKKGKIRGQESQGMICAEDELGIGTDHDGIMVLSGDLKVGTPLAEALTSDADYRLEVAITPNRIDAASHIGVARDVAAFLKSELTMPSIYDKSSLSAPNPIAITIENPEKCQRYVGIFIQNIKVSESPEWLKTHLQTIGLRPINNIVDITNFVMMELGQPLHAFDADKLVGNQVVIRTLAENQAFVTLDEKERNILAGQDLMICDASAPKCIAGVFGGLNSGVTAETTNIFLESAYFDATSVRKTSKRLGISTDSSFRFERGADPNMCEFAALRALLLITELAGGNPSVLTDIKLQEFLPLEIELSIARTQTIIGKEIPKIEIIAILKHLDILVSAEKTEDLLTLQVPAYRVDVTRPQDVMEEVLRIYGFNNIPFPEKMFLSPQYGKRQEPYRLLQQICNSLSAGGYYEIWNNSLISAKYASEMAVPILNPLSEELAVMRESLLWGGLETLRFNQNRQNENLALYEFGKTYWKKEKGYGEKEWLCLWLTGAKHDLHWESKAPKSTFFTLSKEVEKMAKWLGIKGDIREVAHAEMDYAVEFVAKKQVLMTYGKVKQQYLQDFDIRNEVFYLIGDWEKMVKMYFEKDIIYQTISQYPGIRRDVSMFVDSTETFENIRKMVLQVNPQLIRSVELHDVYMGKNIETGKKSYLISFLLQDDSRTLEDAVADKTWEKVCRTLENRIGAQVRVG